MARPQPMRGSAPPALERQVIATGRFIPPPRPGDDPASPRAGRSRSSPEVELAAFFLASTPTTGEEGHEPFV